MHHFRMETPVLHLARIQNMLADATCYSIHCKEANCISPIVTQLKHIWHENEALSTYQSSGKQKQGLQIFSAFYSLTASQVDCVHVYSPQLG